MDELQKQAEAFRDAKEPLQTDLERRALVEGYIAGFRQAVTESMTAVLEDLEKLSLTAPSAQRLPAE